MHTKLFTLAVFSIGPLVHSNNEFTQKGGWYDGSNKSVARFNTFFAVFTKVETTRNLLFSVLLLSAGLKIIMKDKTDVKLIHKQNKHVT